MDLMVDNLVDYFVYQERHWASGMATALQAAINTPKSDRLKETLNLAPRLLDVYFTIALRDINNCMYILLIVHMCITSI